MQAVTAMPPSLKQRLARQFGRAAGRYDAIAKLQWQVAQQAASYLAPTQGRLVDLGCGTGRSRDLLTAKCGHWLGLDISPGMLEFAKTAYGGDYLQADAEQLPLAEASVQRVFSSMALQWCSQLAVLAREIARVLQPQGQGVLAVMLPGSLYELQQSWQAVDGQSHINQFASATQWQQALQQAGLMVTIEPQEIVSEFEDFSALLGSIRNIGANVRQQSASKQHAGFHRQGYQQLQQAYQPFLRQGKWPLTYQIGFINLSKPA